MTPLEWFVSLFFGTLVGFVGGYAGIGGAPFLVFVLGFILDYPQHLAQGTVLAVMLGPMSLPGVIVMWDKVKPNIDIITISVITYAVFSYTGAGIAYLFENQALKLLFSLLLVLLGTHTVRTAREGGGTPAGSPRAKMPFNRLTATWVGALVGIVGGMFGIGAGVLLVPILIWVFGLPKDDARGISLAILLPPVSIGAVIKYNAEEDVKWFMVLILFTSYFASNFWGAQVGRKHNSRRFRLYFGIILITLGALYVLSSLR